MLCSVTKRGSTLRPEHYLMSDKTAAKLSSEGGRDRTLYQTMAPVRTRLTAIMNVMSWLKVYGEMECFIYDSTLETPPSRTYIS